MVDILSTYRLYPWVFDDVIGLIDGKKAFKYRMDEQEFLRKLSSG